MNRIKEFFDGDMCKVLAAAGGTFATLSIDKQVGIIAGCLTCIYISIKIFKQLRDIDKPDKD